MATATNAGTTATYTYNALGQRVRRATSSATTLYVYDEASHLAGEYTATGALIQETVWLGDIPVATLRPNGAGGVILYYVHTDHLNTPRIITDTANNIRWRWDSDLFGNTPPNEDPSGIGTFTYNLRFPGQQYDAVVGLHYNYFRNYDSTVGRYVESDPIGLKGGINTYAYVSGNPLQKADAYGLLETPKPRPPVEEEEWGPSLTGPSICGAEGGKKFPMDFGTSSFEVPCRNHDRCYEICGKSRLECDEAFLRDAKDECKNPAVKRMGGIFSICEGMANHYYTALREGGRDAYLKAQRKNGCCNPQPD